MSLPSPVLDAPLEPAQAEPSGPPSAPVRSRVVQAHGDSRIDPYYWMRNRDDPAVIEYLSAENAWTTEQMRNTEPLQERLYRELLGRIQETDLSVPERLDDWYYYSRTETGRQYPIFCRRYGNVDAPEQICLDLNELAAGHEYFRIGAYTTSPNHRLLAYSTDTTGAETYTLCVKDLETGELLSERIAGTSYGVEWAADNRTLFYTTMDETHRPYRLHRHRLGSDPAADTIAYEELNGTAILSLSKTRSRAFILVDLSSHSSSEVHFLPADQPEAPLALIAPREADVEYTVEHHGERFFIVTNDAAPNFRLVEAPVSAPGKANWRTLIENDAAIKVDGVDAFRHHLVVYEREDALRHIRVLDLRTGAAHRVEFPEAVYTFRATENPEFDTATLRFVYMSLVTPNSVIDYDLDTRAWELRKQQEVRGGYDPSGYHTERAFATAADGTRIPLSLVYRTPLVRDAHRPLLLYGYGSYGSSFDPTFSSNTLSLLDRGFVVAIAHVRGGEEMGRAWYTGGKLLQKRNTFTDFIASAEFLLREGYTSRDRLVINGGSAGGLLMGAVVNMRPELFRAVVAEVPFVDVVTTMLDESIPLTVIEYEEWGNPNVPKYYDYMKSYSPYDNVRSQPYPDMLVTAGLNDPRVAYWEPAKWVARLRATKTDTNRLLLKTNMGAGHSGASGRYDYLREVAFKYAFIFEVLGIA
ncbi:MAG: S9 family peptidase, partial [Gemmatimonadota bacterium]